MQSEIVKLREALAHANVLADPELYNKYVETKNKLSKSELECNSLRRDREELLLTRYKLKYEIKPHSHIIHTRRAEEEIRKLDLALKELKDAQSLYASVEATSKEAFDGAFDFANRQLLDLEFLLQKDKLETDFSAKVNDIGAIYAAEVAFREKSEQKIVEELQEDHHRLRNTIMELSNENAVLLKAKAAEFEKFTATTNDLQSNVDKLKTEIEELKLKLKESQKESKRTTSLESRASKSKYVVDEPSLENQKGESVDVIVEASVAPSTQKKKRTYKPREKKLVSTLSVINEGNEAVLGEKSVVEDSEPLPVSSIPSEVPSLQQNLNSMKPPAENNEVATDSVSEDAPNSKNSGEIASQPLSTLLSVAITPVPSTAAKRKRNAKLLKSLNNNSPSNSNEGNSPKQQDVAEKPTTSRQTTKRGLKRSYVIDEDSDDNAENEVAHSQGPSTKKTPKIGRNNSRTPKLEIVSTTKGKPLQSITVNTSVGVMSKTDTEKGATLPPRINETTSKENIVSGPLKSKLGSGFSSFNLSNFGLKQNFGSSDFRAGRLSLSGDLPVDANKVLNKLGKHFMNI